MHNNTRRPSLGGLIFAAVIIISAAAIVAGCGSSTGAAVATSTPQAVASTATPDNSPTIEPTIAPTVNNNTPVPVDVSGKPVGVDADTKALAANSGLLGGNPDQGSLKYTSLGCSVCHNHGQTGPAMTGTFARITNERLPQNPGRWASPEEYIAESIVHPNAYVVAGFNPGVMPQDWGTKLDLQDLKDLIAFLETQK